MNLYADQATRQEVIIWLYSTKKIKPLQKFGYIYYVSSKMKYAVMYIDSENAEQTMRKIQKLHFVRAVELSPRPTINMNFDEVLPELKKMHEDKIEEKKQASNLMDDSQFSA